MHAPRKSTAKSRAASQCRGAPPEPTAASPKCRLQSGTSSPAKKTAMGLFIRTIGIARSSRTSNAWVWFTAQIRYITPIPT
jgi:hypothetical protein